MTDRMTDSFVNAFSLQFVYYMAVMTILTCALILAAKKSDPRSYDTSMDVVRGVCEALSIITIGYNGVAEINQLRM